MYYSLVTVTAKMGSFPALVQAVGAAMPNIPVQGKLVGAFTAEIGDINRLRMLFSYDAIEGVAKDRERMVGGALPAGLGDLAASLEERTYIPFPGFQPIAPGEYGPVYEFRDYGVRPGCIPTVIEGWMKQLPVRDKLSRNLLTMYCIEGGDLPRYIHIWPYKTLNDRSAIRAEAVRTGAWPPPGLTPNLASQSTSIWMPAPFSPIK